MSDGRQRSFFRKVLDFLLKKRASTYFDTACGRLNQAIENHSISILTKEQQLDILVRMKQISAKLHDKGSREIAELEKTIFQERPDDFLSTADTAINQIFSDDSFDGQDRSMRKLRAILVHSANEDRIIRQLWNSWNAHKQHAQSLSGRQRDFVRDIEALFLRYANNHRVAVPSESNIRLYVQVSFANLLQRKDSGNYWEEIARQISFLNDMMASHQDCPAFLEGILEDIEYFLRESIYFNPLSDLDPFLRKILRFFIHQTTSKHLSELDKKRLQKDYGSFLPLITEYFDSAAPKTQRNLKLHLANLPSNEERSSLGKLYLTKREQNEILVEYFQQLENRYVERILRMTQFVTSDIHILVKLVQGQSRLSQENREKIRDYLVSRGASGKNWDSTEVIRKEIEQRLQRWGSSSKEIKKLARSSKAKIFFENQKGKKEEGILIPRWYHATNLQALRQIIELNQIEVRHEQVHEGAWISSNREKAFGDHTLAFSDQVEQLDPKPSIKYQFDSSRWRGMRRSIPLQDGSKAYLCFVSARDLSSKTKRKASKNELRALLQKKQLRQPVVISTAQLDFVRKRVVKTLGHPNLSPSWWG